jgi:hypothetical protein
MPFWKLGGFSPTATISLLQELAFGAIIRITLTPGEGSSGGSRFREDTVN